MLRLTSWVFHRTELAAARKLLHHVPYSLHASFAELRAFVARLRPRAIRGIVKGSAAAAAPGGSRAKAAPGGRVGASCLDPAVHFADLLSGGSGGGNGCEGGSSGGGIDCSAAAAVSAVTTAGPTAAAAAGDARVSSWQVRGACQSRPCTEGRFQDGNAGEGSTHELTNVHGVLWTRKPCRQHQLALHSNRQCLVRSATMLPHI